MSDILDKLIPKRRALAVLVVVLITGGLLAGLVKIPSLLFGETILSDLFAYYGLTIFVLYPIFIGLLTAVAVGYHEKIGLGAAFDWSLIALIAVGISSLLYAIEGLICIIMAFPICVVSLLAGCGIGFLVVKSSLETRQSYYSCFAAFLFIFPAFGFFEAQVTTAPEAKPISTSVVINAPPDAVWKNVVEFPELAPPTELIFRTGIAYPIRARIEGSGVGAIRYCEFSTGAFVEPITVWDENKLLEFSVDEQPIPMREISPYGELDTPHLHDFFVSKRGQFKLTRLETGETLLEGTTWYYHNIAPEIYWCLWSEEIIHTIHRRVLNHIKERAESEN